LLGVNSTLPGRRENRRPERSRWPVRSPVCLARQGLRRPLIHKQPHPHGVPSETGRRCRRRRTPELVPRTPPLFFLSSKETSTVPYRFSITDSKLPLLPESKSAVCVTMARNQLLVREKLRSRLPVCLIKGHVIIKTKSLVRTYAIPTSIKTIL
jgi:hypothetical protein